MRYIPIEELVTRIEQISRNIDTEFTSLTQEQINTKLSPDSWSIAQCLDRIIVINKSYFPQIEQIIAGTKKKTFYERLPMLSKLWGKLLIKVVSRNAEKKVKTFEVFNPSSTNLPGTIIKDLALNNSELIELMKKTYQLDTEKIIITSPVFSYMTYSLKDALIILTLHEERHFNQAKRVKETL